MDQQRLATMMEATRLTRKGKLAEAAALLQPGLADLLSRLSHGARATPNGSISVES